jgi:hypothetical protein
VVWFSPSKTCAQARAGGRASGRGIKPDAKSRGPCSINQHSLAALRRERGPGWDGASRISSAPRSYEPLGGFLPSEATKLKQSPWFLNKVPIDCQPPFLH